jgi:hypothetical protein
MPRARAGRIHDRRAVDTSHLETLLDEVLQGQRELRQEQRAITERLDRIVVRLEQKHGGGHPLEYDWSAVRLAMLNYANLNGFESAAEVRNFTCDFITQWDKQPSNRAIQDFLRPLLKALSPFPKDERK